MIRVLLRDMPCKVHSFVSRDDADNYTIVINSHLSAEMQKEAYSHELRHIESHDFRDEDINTIESECHS